MTWMGRVVVGAVLALVVAGCGSSPSTPTSPPSATTTTASRPGPSASVTNPPVGSVPRFRHIVVVVEENHGFRQILGNAQAPYFNQLARGGALLTQSYAVTHPSEPNYLALFTGSTEGLSSDSCPHSFGGPNLASALASAGKTFTGFAEGLPSPGSTVCAAGSYARKHNPWSDFPALPASVNQPLSSFPGGFSLLPTVSFVIPNLDHDMHDGTVAVADTWLRTHLGPYATWATTHDSLLIVTFDEDSGDEHNRIPTIFYGARVRPGEYAQHTTHVGVLRTIVAAEGLPPFGPATTVGAVIGMWTPP